MIAAGGKSSHNLRHIFRRALLLIGLLCLWACTANPTYLPPATNKPTSFYLAAEPHAPIPRVISQLAHNHPGKSGIYPITSAQDALAARLSAIRAARTSIDIQYFIFRRDETALLLTRELLAAAQRGVRVRFLLDDFTTRSADQVLLQMSWHRNIQLRLFNPHLRHSPRYFELVLNLARLHRRMHNKSLTIDNSVTFIGGRNISNKYFGFDKKYTFGDIDVVAIGNIVTEISGQFDEYWNSDFSFPIQQVVKAKTRSKDLQQFEQLLHTNAAELENSGYGQSLKLSPVMQSLQHNASLWYWGDSHILVDPLDKLRLNPDEIDAQMESRAIQEVLSAKQQLVIISPYLLPGKRYAAELIDAARRGVEIHILTNSLASTDVAPVYGAYRKYRKPFLQAGIHLYEMPSTLEFKLDSWFLSSKSLLHAKTYVIDQRSVYFGSFNFDIRSLYWNTELGIVVDSPQLAGKITENFKENIGSVSYRLMLENGEIVWQGRNGKKLERDPGATLWQRISSRITGWLPLEHYL